MERLEQEEEEKAMEKEREKAEKAAKKERGKAADRATKAEKEAKKAAGTKQTKRVVRDDVQLETDEEIS